MSDAKLSHLTSFTQDSELTQDTHLDYLPDTQQFLDLPIPSSIDVFGAFVALGNDGMLPCVTEKIYGDNTKKTKQNYSRWYLKYFAYVQSEGQNIFVESTSCKYFHNMIENKVFSVGSLWSIYVKINKSMRKLHRVKINTWEELGWFLINITKWYIPKKSDVFSKEQLNKVLTECFYPYQPEDILALIVIVLMLSVILRHFEVMVIMVS